VKGKEKLNKIPSPTLPLAEERADKRIDVG
jgi:hypothetical protein